MQTGFQTPSFVNAAVSGSGGVLPATALLRKVCAPPQHSTHTTPHGPARITYRTAQFPNSSTGRHTLPQHTPGVGPWPSKISRIQGVPSTREPFLTPPPREQVRMSSGVLSPVLCIELTELPLEWLLPSPLNSWSADFARSEQRGAGICYLP